MRIFKIQILIFLLSLSFKTYATHITNSELQCKFLDSTGSSYRYLVRLVMIRDCNPGSIQFNDKIEIGAYSVNSAQLTVKQTLRLGQVSLFSNCNNTCQEQAYYESEITLPKNASGYHLCVQFCCRNNSNNILLDQNNNSFQGNTPYCRIRGNAPVSTSTSTIPPFVYLNNGKRDTIQYEVYDLFSDSVTVALTTPLQGADLSNNYPNTPTVFPGFSPISYAAGYNVLNPLGPAAECILDTKNKQLRLLGNTNGNFTVAFTISSYKKGILISRIIKECIIYVSPSFASIPKIQLSAHPNSEPSVRLSWSSCLPDLYAYHIERSDSLNGNYIAIDSLNSETRSYKDLMVNYNKWYYYRIKAFSLNGQLRYSDTVKVQLWGADLNPHESFKTSKLIIYPLPGASDFTIRLKENTKWTYSVFDIRGNTVLTGQNTLNEEELKISLNGLAEGIYFLVVLTASGEKHSAQLQKF